MTFTFAWMKMKDEMYQQLVKFILVINRTQPTLEISQFISQFKWINKQKSFIESNSYIPQLKTWDTFWFLTNQGIGRHMEIYYGNHHHSRYPLYRMRNTSLWSDYFHLQSCCLAPLHSRKSSLLFSLSTAVRRSIPMFCHLQTWNLQSKQVFRLSHQLGLQQSRFLVCFGELQGASLWPEAH